MIIYIKVNIVWDEVRCILVYMFVELCFKRKIDGEFLISVFEKWCGIF